MCCLLAEPGPFAVPLFRDILPPWIDVTQAEQLEHRVRGGDRVGLVYTVRGGFIDLGHLRDVADLTRYYHEALSQPDRLFPPGAVPGRCQVHTPLFNADHRLAIARSMAYAESVFHEVETYYQGFPGMHNSSFSPEDLPSNWLGTYVAEQALRDTAHTYEEAVAIALATLLAHLGAVPPALSQIAFGMIRDIWISGNPAEPTYLRRRNFTNTPWLVPGMAFVPGTPSIDTAWPSDISLADRTVSPQSGAYEITFSTPYGIDIRRAPLGVKVRSSEFPTHVVRIRDDARLRYGVKADQP